jgi:hypothetical protein
MYGVTLWEVFSLGVSPKLCPDLTQLPNCLGQGKRLEQPQLAPEVIYNLMKKCWLTEKTMRPTFAEICKLMHGFSTHPQNLS